jgi:single-strand DNA-binding protein
MIGVHPSSPTENEFMASVNKVILIGNLGRDPELRYTQSGQAVTNFSIATTERFGGREGGDPQERTEWHRIVTWGKTAENCAQYLAKGRSVYIEGSLRTRDWEDREGNKRQTTEISAQRVQFLGGPRSGGAPGPSGGGARGSGGGSTGAPEGGPPPPESGGDDIPF